MPEESWQEAATRACADELNARDIDLSGASYQFSEESRESGGMPGIPTCYGLHLVRVEVTKAFVEGFVGQFGANSAGAERRVRRGSLLDQFFSIGTGTFLDSYCSPH